jgi:hypothetical protein
MLAQVTLTKLISEIWQYWINLTSIIFSYRTICTLWLRLSWKHPRFHYIIYSKTYYCFNQESCLHN